MSILFLLLAMQAIAAPPGTPIVLPPAPAVGSTPTVAADPRVAVPPTPPCTVPLFAEREFLGDARQAIAYRPPADCPGPWAKVVVVVDIRVTPGKQYDRTNILNLGGVNLFTGTTMEPSAKHGPVWHVERDVTDYAALLRRPAEGEALLTNYIDATYTGRVFVGARLVFYPADAANPAPAAPDWIAPVTTTLTRLDEKQPEAARTLTFPANVERLAIDVLAQPQATDEFWAFCTPDRLQPAGKKIERPCGEPYRETEVSIDGTPVGVAPAFPWIYTGGINPLLWRVTPAPDVLNLTPYRVDLTPFAALVNDGRPHRIGLKVAGVRSYFFGMGTLLAWLDPGRRQVTGAVVRNTLAAAVPTVSGTVAGTGLAQKGDTRTTVNRTHVAEGWLDTSHGRVTTRVETRLAFSNHQWGSDADGTMEQLTTIDTRTRVTPATGPVRTATVAERWPLRFEQRGAAASGVASHAIQSFERHEIGYDGATRSVLRHVDTSAATTVDTAGARAVKSHGRLRTHFADSAAGCADRIVSVRDFIVTAVTDAPCGRGARR